jgi:hypothetical protein
LIYDNFREQRLIEDLLQPTGIIIKPSDNQLKEFAKRVKSLDKETIFEMLYGKMLNYETMNDTNNSKIIMVSKLIIILILLSPSFLF